MRLVRPKKEKEDSTHDQCTTLPVKVMPETLAPVCASQVLMHRPLSFMTLSFLRAS